jgi:hypothetical protein
VIIPGNVDRKDYIIDCFRRSVVTVQFENGSSMMDIPIAINVLQDIEFPDDYGQLGSCLICGVEPIHNFPIVIGRLLKGDESTNLGEHEFRLSKDVGNASVSIVGKGDLGNLFIKVSKKPSLLDSEGGNIYIDVINSDFKGGVYLNVQGDINIEVQNIIMKILNNLNISSKKDINIDSETEINLGTPDKLQAILKGNDTVEQLKKELQAMTDLLQSIASITPLPVTSGAPDGTWAAWQAAVAAIVNRGNYDNISSEKNFAE